MLIPWANEGKKALQHPHVLPFAPPNSYTTQSIHTLLATLNKPANAHLSLFTLV